MVYLSNINIYIYKYIYIYIKALGGDWVEQFFFYGDLIYV